MAGAYKGTITFGTTALTASSGSWDPFILKLDPSGNPVWVVHAAAQEWQAFRKLAVDGQGNVVAVGDVDGTADFGGQTFGPVDFGDGLVPHAGEGDGFRRPNPNLQNSAQ